MTSPRTPESGAASPATISCIEPDCERPVVHSAVRCRVHLAEALQSEGETIPFEDPELAGMLAAAIQIVRTALAGLPQELLSPSAPASRTCTPCSTRPPNGSSLRWRWTFWGPISPTHHRSGA